MKKLKLLILLLCPFLLASAPSRVHTYTSGEKIYASEVTANEDAIFNYLNAGVEVYYDGTILNADVNSAANIQCGKLNLTACAQNILTSGTITATGAIATSAGLSATGLTVSQTITIPYSTTLPSTCTTGQMYIDTDADTTGSLYICVNSSWKEVDDD